MAWCGQYAGRRTLYLDYEAYEAMALAQMEALAAETRARFVVRAVSIIHRLGGWKLGDERAGRVAAAHRARRLTPAVGYRHAQETVPIWKKNTLKMAVWADGEHFPKKSAAGARGPSAHLKLC